MVSYFCLHRDEQNVVMTEAFTNFLVKKRCILNIDSAGCSEICRAVNNTCSYMCVCVRACYVCACVCVISVCFV